MNYTVQEKVSFLESVIERIQINGTIEDQYSNSKGMHCAIGWMMYEADVNLGAFEGDTSLNGEFINDLMLSDDPMIVELMEPLKEYGFTVADLHKLQYLNDQEPDSFQRAIDIQDYLKYMIKELQA